MFGFAWSELLALVVIAGFVRWVYLGRPGRSWLRVHFMDGLVTTLVGVSLSAFGWHAESPLIVVGGVLVVVGVSGSVLARRTRRDPSRTRPPGPGADPAR